MDRIAHIRLFDKAAQGLILEILLNTGATIRQSMFESMSNRNEMKLNVELGDVQQTIVVNFVYVDKLTLDRHIYMTDAEIGKLLRKDASSSEYYHLIFISDTAEDMVAFEKYANMHLPVNLSLVSLVINDVGYRTLDQLDLGADNSILALALRSMLQNS